MVKVGTRCNSGHRKASFQRHFRQGAALCLLAQDWLRQAWGKRRTGFGGLCKPCHLLTSVLLTLALLLGGCKNPKPPPRPKTTPPRPEISPPTRLHPHSRKSPQSPPRPATLPRITPSHPRRREPSPMEVLVLPGQPLQVTATTRSHSIL